MGQNSLCLELKNSAHSFDYPLTQNNLCLASALKDVYYMVHILLRELCHGRDLVHQQDVDCIDRMAFDCCQKLLKVGVAPKRLLKRGEQWENLGNDCIES